MVPVGLAEMESSGVEAVPFTRMAEFLRLLAHDVRNDLNAVDLLTAYIRDMAEEPGVRGELDQLRTAIRYGSERMQRLARAFQTPDPEKFPIPVGVLVEDVRARVERMHPEVFSRVEWEGIPGERVLSVDVGLMGEAFCELIENAASFAADGAAVVFRVDFPGPGGVHFVLEQRLAETLVHMSGECELWGRKPFVSARRGHYGLGLFRVRRVLEAHGTGVRFVPDRQRGVLETRVEFDRGGEGA